MENMGKVPILTEDFMKLQRTIAIFILLTLCFSPMAFANKIVDSFIGKGTVELANDMSGFLMLLAPIIAVCASGYFLIRRSSANEHDGIMWNKRIVTAIICGVAVFLISGVISLITSYFR